MFLKSYVKMRTIMLCKKGQSMMEYALLAALIAIFLIAAIYAFRDALTAKFNDITKAFTTAS